MTLLEDYLQGRPHRVVVNGRASTSAPIGTSVPLGSIFGPLLWSINIEDLVHQLPVVKAFADDSVVSYSQRDSSRCIAAVKRELKIAEEWEKLRQVNFALAKTHPMVVFRFPAATQDVKGQLRFGNVQLQLQDNINVL